MDSFSFSQTSVTNNKSRSQLPKKVWTLQEENELIVGLKELVSRGWKCDNGFKTGYLMALETHIMEIIPGTDIKSEPHIHSKIHVWKKQYSTLRTILTRSGFGWNDTSNVLEVIDDQVWNEYVKVGLSNYKLHQ